MIQGYKNRETEELAAQGICDKKFRSFRRQAEKRLRILDAAESKNELMILKSNRFEALHGDREGQFSISINMQWRICFTWDDNTPGPLDVEIVDYH